MSHASLAILSSIGMLSVPAAAILWSRQQLSAGWRQFSIGAALWVVAVSLKVGCALLANQIVFAFLRAHVAAAWFVVCGSLWVGIQSSFCEIGLTWMAGRIWPQLGSDAAKAISIGVGAGAFEAALLGFGSLAAAIVCLAELPGTETAATVWQSTAASTPLFWMVPPVERGIAILCHAPARALALLGAAHRRPGMAAGGFLLFMLVDGIAGAFHLSGKVGHVSLWWVELAILPFALAGVPILRWCRQNWPRSTLNPVTQ